MKSKSEGRRLAVRFRRYCRGRWAAFSSMHREVTIGRLAVYIADRQLRKSSAVAAGCLFAALGVPVQAQTDDEREARTLPAVEVMLSTEPTVFSVAEPAAVVSPDHAARATVRTIADLLALLPGVDLRIRGVGDAQGDLSVRGGTFDQTLVLLNGINLSDAQTGHYTLDIPIDMSMVERVELLTPAQLMARGVVAFCGAVNIVVSDEYRDRLLADLGVGVYGTLRASMLGTKAAGRWVLTASASYSRSDGYMSNTDYRHGGLFLQAGRHGERHDLHVQLGGQLKGYGSHGFYSTAYPDQYEHTGTVFGSVAERFRLSGFDVRVSAYGRFHRDRFELFREGYVDAPSWYGGHNHHLSSLAGLSLRGVRPLGVGELVAGVDLRREGIWSNVLGLPDSLLAAPFDHSDSRRAASFFGGYGMRRGRFSAEAVALGVASSHFGPNYGLAAMVGHGFQMVDVRLSFSRTYRFPTFTDLYYQGPSQQSNPALEPEASTDVELGVRGRFPVFDFGFSVYRRLGRDIIDWVRSPEEELWRSMNHTAVDATGLDASARFRLSVFSFQVDYSLCHIDQDAAPLISGSALDYLRHRFGAHVRFPVSDFRFSFSAAYRYREGQYVDESGEVQGYGGVLLLNGSVEYDLRGLTLYVQGSNLTGAVYRDHGGVPQPGVTAMAGVRTRL